MIFLFIFLPKQIKVKTQSSSLICRKSFLGYMNNNVYDFELKLKYFQTKFTYQLWKSYGIGFKYL
jgi:hypothetical protein